MRQWDSDRESAIGMFLVLIFARWTCHNVNSSMLIKLCRMSVIAINIPTEGEGGILFWARILLASTLALSLAAASASA